jgi:hypothetical protein
MDFGESTKFRLKYSVLFSLAGNSIPACLSCSKNQFYLTEFFLFPAAKKLFSKNLTLTCHHMRILKITLLLFLFSHFFFSGFGQTPESILDSINAGRKPKKLFTHFDKQFYQPGATIWAELF